MAKTPQTTKRGVEDVLYVKEQFNFGEIVTTIVLQNQILKYSKNDISGIYICNRFVFLTLAKVRIPKLLKRFFLNRIHHNSPLQRPNNFEQRTTGVLCYLGKIGKREKYLNDYGTLITLKTMITLYDYSITLLSVFPAIVLGKYK